VLSQKLGCFAKIEFLKIFLPVADPRGVRLVRPHPPMRPCLVEKLGFWVSKWEIGCPLELNYIQQA